MEIRSIFGGITSWNQLEPGVLFYVPIKAGTRLGMKVEQSGEYRNSPLYSCLLFDSASRLESSNRCQQATLVELKDAAFISTKIAAFSDPPLVGQIIQVREHGPLLNVLDQKWQLGSSAAWHRQSAWKVAHPARGAVLDS
jgi:hypothetical protein